MISNRMKKIRKVGWIGLFIAFDLLGKVAMAEISVTRLGKIVPGTITKNQFVEHTIEYDPIVLGSARGEPTVLYLERDIKIPVGHGVISINRIETEHSLKSKIKNAFDGYPIKFSGTALTKSQENKLDFVVEGTPTTADLDGDGEQEFVFATQQGNIEVFDGHKKRFSYTLNTGSPKVSYFDFRPWCRHVAQVGGKDIVFLVMLRNFYGEFEAEKKAALVKELGAYVIVKIDQHGIAPLSLQTLPRDARVQGVAGINYPGSNAIDEIVTLLELEKTKEHEGGLWLYRHRLDGSQIAAPRKTYGEERLPEGVEYTFTPGSKTLVGKGGSNLYFIHPQKDVNWIRAVPAANLVGANITEILAVIKHSDRLLALVSEDKALYLLDEEGRFYTLAEGNYQANRQKIALTNLTPPSPQHTLKTLKGSGDSTRILAIYTRPQQEMSLKDDEVLAAAEKYLQPDVRKDKQEDAEFYLSFNSTAVRAVDRYCQQRNIKCPELKSVADIQRELPDVYQKMVKDSRYELITGLKSALFTPLGWHKTENLSTENVKFFETNVITDTNTYYSWLKAHALECQLVLTAYNLSGGILVTQSVQGYDILEDGGTQPAIKYNSGQWTVVLAMQQVQNYKGSNGGFYRLTW